MVLGGQPGDSGANAEPRCGFPATKKRPAAGSLVRRSRGSFRLGPAARGPWGVCRTACIFCEPAHLIRHLSGGSAGYFTSRSATEWQLRSNPVAEVAGSRGEAVHLRPSAGYFTSRSATGLQLRCNPVAEVAGSRGEAVHL